MAVRATPHIKAWSLERNLNRIEGERHLKARNYGEAEKYLTLAVTEADEQRHSVRIVQFRLFLAEAQRRQGKLSEAEQTVRTALEHTARISNPAGYVQCLDALAEVFHDAGNFGAMQQVLEEGVRIESSSPRPDSLRMARRVHRLGVARHKNGSSGNAIPALQKAVTLHENAYGEEHLETANLLSDLGAVHRAHGNLEEAQQCLRRALRIHEAQCGLTSPESARDIQNLAGTLEDAGDIEGAAAQYERVLTVKERMVGEDLEVLAEMKFSLAGMYIQWNKYGRARELLLESLGYFQRQKGPRLAVAHESLAYVNECMGRYPEALAEMARACKVWELCGPAKVAERIENMKHRAGLLDQLRKRTEAAWLRAKVEELIAPVEEQAHRAAS